MQYQGALAEISSLKDSNPQEFQTLMVTYPALQGALNNDAPILTVTPQVTTSSELSQALDDPSNYTAGQRAVQPWEGKPMVALDGFTPGNTTSDTTVYEGLADEMMSKALVVSDQSGEGPGEDGGGSSVLGQLAGATAFALANKVTTRLAAQAAGATFTKRDGDAVQLLSDTVSGFGIVKGDDLTLAPSAPTRYIPANLRNLSLQDALDTKSYKIVMDMNDSIRRTLRENDNAVESEAKTIPEQMQQYTILRKAVPNDRTKKLYDIFRVKAIQRLDAIKEKMDDVGVDIEVVQNFLTDVDNGEATNVLEKLMNDRDSMANRAVILKTIVSDNRVDLSPFTTLTGGDDDTREGRINKYADAVASRVNLTGDVNQKRNKLLAFKKKVRKQFESDFRFKIPGFKEKYKYSHIRLQFDEALSTALSL
jgi:hypothetical protein